MVWYNSASYQIYLQWKFLSLASLSTLPALPQANVHFQSSDAHKCRFHCYLFLWSFSILTYCSQYTIVYTGLHWHTIVNTPTILVYTDFYENLPESLGTSETTPWSRTLTSGCPSSRYRMAGGACARNGVGAEVGVAACLIQKIGVWMERSCQQSLLVCKFYVIFVQINLQTVWPVKKMPNVYKSCPNMISLEKW